MPKHVVTLPRNGRSSESLIPLLIGTFQHLKWNLKHAGPAGLVGHTPRSWKTWGEQITAELFEETFVIRSEMVHGEAWDPFKRNRKNVAKFVSAFEEVQATATPGQTSAWAADYDLTFQQTVEAAAIEEQESAEVERVMQLSGGQPWITYGLIAINVLVFVLMAIGGVNVFEPSIQDLLRWGANHKPQTTGGEAWRLFTCMFVHIGLMHLLLNLYALYMAGVYLERMLGGARYLAAYLGTGLLASITSLWWHGDNSVSAGASGAVFGLYGLFLALLTTSLIPRKVRKGLLQSIAIFVGYNLLYGMKGGIDNSAHMGGLVSGIVVGYLYYFGLRQPARTKGLVVAAAVLVAAVGLSLWYVGAARSDLRAYEQRLEQFSKAEETALAVRQKEEGLQEQLVQVSAPAWKEAVAAMQASQSYELGDLQQRQRDLLLEYAQLRQQENDLLIRYFETGEAPEGLSKVQQQIEEKMKALQSLQ